MVNIRPMETDMSLDQAVGLEEVYLVDNCLIKTLPVDELKRNPRAYFTTRRVLDEHRRWAEKERRPLLEKEQRQGWVFRLEEIERSLRPLEEILRSNEYKDVCETTTICDELEGTETQEFELGLLYFARQNSLRIDLTGDEKQKQEIKNYFTLLKQKRLLLEEYSIDIKIDENSILIASGSEKRRAQIKDISDLRNKFSYQQQISRLNEKKQLLMKEGKEFFRAETIANCFETELQNQILYMHSGAQFERYSRLLTKKIIADVLQQNQEQVAGLLIAGNIDYVVGIGIKEYKKRIEELELEGVISSERINATKQAMYKILHGLHKDVAAGKELHKYWVQFGNSIKSDLGLVCAAFTRKFPAKKVTILSADRDVQELVEYLNLARQAGKIHAQNREIAYATEVRQAA